MRDLGSWSSSPLLLTIVIAYLDFLSTPQDVKCGALSAFPSNQLLIAAPDRVMRCAAVVASFQSA